MSSYQADWFVDEEGGTHFDEEDIASKDGDANGDMVVNDTDKNQHIDGDGDSIDDIDDDDDIKSSEVAASGRSIGREGDEALHGIKMSKEELRRRDLVREERMDAEFPDEVDTPDDVSARVRFARYRALQSFRSSPWHPKENLPEEYARIFQFENFGIAQRRSVRLCLMRTF
jgi:pre-rRNA-processing protein TSR1